MGKSHTEATKLKISLTKRRDPVERFLEKIELDLITGCWNWTARKFWGGYGCFRVTGPARNVSANRFSYSYFKGPIPPGLVVDHVCKNRACCNPDHLEAVTYKENTRREGSRRKLQCRNGHPFDDRNTYVHDGQRSCRRCAADRVRLKRHVETSRG